VAQLHQISHHVGDSFVVLPLKESRNLPNRRVIIKEISDLLAASTLHEEKSPTNHDLV
jgi:hypothetical protein